MRDRHGRPKTTHGLSKSREFRAWISAQSRCYNPNYQGFANYGGRGIAMCDEWRADFAAFFHEMGPCPAGYSLDRIDNNGPYAPGNCRWANAREQGNNRRYCLMLEHDGQRLTATEWARRLGGTKNAVNERLRQGWSIERAVTTPFKARGLAALARRAGIKSQTVKQRLCRGWPIERALNEPTHYRGQ